MEETILLKKNSSGYQYFVFPQVKEKYVIRLFGYKHNEGEPAFPFKGDVVSSHVESGKSLKVGNFFITENKSFIVLAIDELGFLYGSKNNDENYIIIDNPPKFLMTKAMLIIEKQYFSKKLNTDSELYIHTLK